MADEEAFVAKTADLVAQMSSQRAHLQDELGTALPDDAHAATTCVASPSKAAHADAAASPSLRKPLAACNGASTGGASGSDADKASGTLPIPIMPYVSADELSAVPSYAALLLGVARAASPDAD